MPGNLFSAYFLTDGIALNADWDIAPDTLAAARQAIAALVADFEQRHGPNEANTEHDFIEPVLRLIGWTNLSKQEKASPTGRADVPDYLLFLNDDNKQAAVRAAADRYRHGATIVEGKRWGFALDNATRADAAPSTQMLRYLGAVDGQSDGAIRFGILTNGRIWRLYDHRARSRLEGFVEIDLAEAAGLVVPAERPRDDHADHVLRLFLYLFGRDAFLPDAAGRTRLERSIDASRGFEARVTDELADTVFETVFPDLADALARNDPERRDDPAYFAELREAALTWLYRLLFTLYAEDRDLIPTRSRRDGLRQMRNEVAHAIDTGERLSSHAENDGDLRRLWRKIDIGDDGIGLPPYNGGLFREGRSALLDRSLIPDAAFAPLLDALSRERIGDRPRLINYRDLNVQHLGSVYERLLEYDVVEEDGRIVARPQTFARKTSGSYYTPEELVMLVIRRTVGPLLEERERAFLDASTAEARTAQAKDAPDYPLARLAEHDPAAAFLKLRIVDPAMGSGHFLVSLVDYLADRTMLATTEAAAAVGFGEYRSPLLDRLEAIRARIREQAAEHDWRVDEAQLIDRQLVRRIILKRVIHGVDKNPMAVELAKLSLWLHTFTVGAPLSFLDHHLRCGDSLFGEWVRPALRLIQSHGDLMQPSVLARAQQAATGMLAIEELSDASIAEVHDSQDNFVEVERETAPLKAVLSMLHAFRWLSIDDPRVQFVMSSWLDGSFGDPVAVAQGYWTIDTKLEDGEPVSPSQGRMQSMSDRSVRDAAQELLPQALHLAVEQAFFPWQVAFPGVWSDWFPDPPPGGFDAVIGNPPWAKVELDVVNWFDGRNDPIARAPSDAVRVNMINGLRETNPEQYDGFNLARSRFAQAVRVAQTSKAYPLFSSGRPDLYQLFVEQALKLVNSRGIVGLLVPSGVIADRAASRFVRTIAPAFRLLSFTDFENRRPQGPHFFPEVHASARFAVTVIGGAARTAPEFDAVFFAQTADPEELESLALPISPSTFERLNPNTGTAIIFRNRRDAQITLDAYERVPILRDSDDDPVWPVRYSQMLNQSTDSGRFETAAALERQGYYPVASNRWRKKHRIMLPLYEGKMVQAFDHRAADVALNEGNRRRQGQGQSLGAVEHADPDRYPNPRAFVSKGKVPKRARHPWLIAFKDITATTNARTMIASALPESAAVHTLPILLPAEGREKEFVDATPHILANLNSFAFDFLARQKVQGTHMSWYIVEQLPVIPPGEYARTFGNFTAGEIVAREVLHLTYTSHDMAPFARDMGFVDIDTGEIPPPIHWDEADRRQRRARLDALYFHLYGIGRDDADYILSTFNGVRRNDEREFDRYLTRDLILAQMAALQAEDPDAVIVLR